MISIAMLLLFQAGIADKPAPQNSHLPPLKACTRWPTFSINRKFPSGYAAIAEGGTLFICSNGEWVAYDPTPSVHYNNQLNEVAGPPKPVAAPPLQHKTPPEAEQPKTCGPNHDMNCIAGGGYWYSDGCNTISCKEGMCVSTAMACTNNSGHPEDTPLRRRVENGGVR